MARAGPIHCVTCKRPASYRFCSDDCFKAYVKTRAGVDCAICRYHHGGSIGGLESNRICPDCRSDPANKDWRRAPRNERNGFDLDIFEARSGHIEATQPMRFRSEKALAVLRLIAKGDTCRQAAEKVGCSRQYAKMISQYWGEESNNLLKEIPNKH